jgi:hypothetical protein
MVSPSVKRVKKERRVYPDRPAETRTLSGDGPCLFATNTAQYRRTRETITFELPKESVGVARNVLLWIVCGVWLAGTAWGQGERRLSLDDYRDRMKGGWIGQIIGVAWGAPTEFKFNDVIIPQEKGAGLEAGND